MTFPNSAAMLSLPSISSSTAACPPEGEAFSSFSSIRMRPAALIRGPILKTMSSMVMLVLVQAADLDDRQQSFRRFAVEVFQPEMGKDTVFAHQGYDIRSDAHDQQV